MKWEGNRESSNLEDRRDGASSVGTGMRTGGRGGRSIGIGTIVIALIGGWIFGVNPLTVLGLLGGGGETPTQQVQPVPARPLPANDTMAKFVSTVLADTEDVWREIFSNGKAVYQEPKLVLFRGSTPTACGAGESAMGPFYCPGDLKVYIDLAFYETLKSRLGAPGDFAQAYVIAHEVGHHVQNLLGIHKKVAQLRQRAGSAESNALSVRVELQADCFAGVWAHHAHKSRQVLENGDVEEAMNAAAKIGDDALQKNSGRAVVPESFTHGTSAQRQRWFNAGLNSGSIKACDTFSARSL